MKFIRINNPNKIDASDIKRKLCDNILTIQFDEEVYTDKILSELNEIVLTSSENLEIRFYAHYNSSFDLKTLLKVKNVKNLSIDCLRKIENINCLAELKNLKRLSIGVENFKDYEFLQFENLKTLEKLCLDVKNVNLKYLEEYQCLKYLAICGNQKNYNAISTLNNLEELHLRSQKKATTFEFVNALNNLKKISVSFGSRESVEEISNINIEEFHIFRIRNLKSIGKISRFKNLKKLRIEDQAQITSIIFDEKINTLNELAICNCKKLEEIEGLFRLTQLEYLILVQLPKICFDEFILKKLPQNLKLINFYTGKKQDIKIEEKIKDLGYDTT